jgi:hypothetical protein
LADRADQAGTAERGHAIDGDLSPAASQLLPSLDDSRSGRDTGAETFGFTRLETAHDLDAAGGHPQRSPRQ